MSITDEMETFFNEKLDKTQTRFQRADDVCVDVWGVG